VRYVCFIAVMSMSKNTDNVLELNILKILKKGSHVDNARYTTKDR